MITAPTVCIIPGDGIGAEVTACARRVVDAAVDVLGGTPIVWEVHPAGHETWLDQGRALPEDTLAAAKGADAVLMGAFAVASIPAEADHPLRGLRRGLEIRASIRPSKGMTPNGPLDLVVVREVTEGLYSGIEYMVGDDTACAVRVVTRAASLATARVAFQQAEQRAGRVTVVHKISALKMSDGLFIACAREVAREFPGVELTLRAVDACAMDLITDPDMHDVILTTNAFGDILSDVAASLSGGVGVAPSACIGDRWAYFEPVHGTAPGKAGRGIANPIATIRTAAMMLDHLGWARHAVAIETAVAEVLVDGPRTVDRGGNATSDEMTAAVIGALRP